MLSTDMHYGFLTSGRKTQQCADENTYSDVLVKEEKGPLQ
jgi:hypothetical protein